jgi:hypothetical protein
MKQLRIYAGGALLVVGYLILLLPGPLGWPGIPPMALGAILILSASPKAKRWFVSAARQEPLMLGRFRKFLRARAKKRHAKATTST